ncbi:MAG: Kelch repeat-containing protein [Planctomycetota bacterium]
MNARILAPLLALAAVAPAQSQLNKLTAGRLGSTIAMQISQAPANNILLLFASQNAGPTPLSAVDPTDTRSLQVGSELAGQAVVMLTSPSGGALFSCFVPNNPALHGFAFHWQALTISFFGPLFGAITNDVVTLTGSPDQGVLAPTAMAQPRSMGVTIVDRDNNSGTYDVVFAGGGTGSLTSASGLVSTELWDYRRMRMVAGPAMTAARSLHVGVQLADGRTLLIGGANAAGAALAACEIYNPVTNSFTATGAMASPRVLHAACRLADGRVMDAGGTNTLLPDVPSALAGALASVEIWNPTTGAWTAANPLGGRRIAPALTRLPDGQILASGGIEFAPVFGVPNAATVATVQRWNPATSAWSNGPNMNQPRCGHHTSQALLADGRVLFTGSYNIASIATAATATPGNGAELFSPGTNTWTTTPMPTARVLHTTTRLGDGRIVVAGGSRGTLSATLPIDDVDVFNPATNTWTSTPPLTTPRAGHCAELMPDGTLVLFGGQSGSGAVTTVETIRF